MNTKDIIGQFPNASKEFISWLITEMNMSIDFFDNFYWLTRIATFNCFLGYSMNTLPYQNIDQTEAFNEIISKFRLLEQSIPFKVTDEQFIRFINAMDYNKRKDFFPGIDLKDTSDCIADCVVLVNKRLFISDCVIRIQKRKSIMDCITLLSVSEDEYIKKFWEESIKFSWLIKQGAQVCPF